MDGMNVEGFLDCIYKYNMLLFLRDYFLLRDAHRAANKGPAREIVSY